MLHQKNEQIFRRKERVRRREDLNRLLTTGSRYYSKQYTMILVKNDLDYLRFAVSVKKSTGSAVVRNYEKRLCRELFRKEKENLKKGFDILILVRSATRNFNESYEMLKNLVYRHLE